MLSEQQIMLSLFLIPVKSGNEEAAAESALRILLRLYPGLNRNRAGGIRRPASVNQR